jgi:pyrroline-5-carboxylate reductase
VVSTTGSHLSSTVSAVAGKLASGIEPISPAGAGVVRHTGNTAGHVIKGATGAVGGLLGGGR